MTDSPVVRTSVTLLGTARGPARLLMDVVARPRALLLLGHGAGGGTDAFDLDALAHGLPRHEIAVARFEQPWRTAGKKVAGPAASLDAAWHSALAAVRRACPTAPLFVGGRSAGARVACRRFADPAQGVVALSFPLHPPGRPDRSRLHELALVTGPVLVLQGERDPFGSASDVREALGDSARHTVIEIKAAGHSLRPGKRSDPDRAVRLIVESVADFMLAD